jgi:hypothetical protein
MRVCVEQPWKLARSRDRASILDSRRFFLSFLFLPSSHRKTKANLTSKLNITPVRFLDLDHETVARQPGLFPGAQGSLQSCKAAKQNSFTIVLSQVGHSRAHFHAFSSN